MNISSQQRKILLSALVIAMAVVAWWPWRIGPLLSTDASLLRALDVSFLLAVMAAGMALLLIWAKTEHE